MTIPLEMTLKPGDAVRHKRHGAGEVIADMGQTVVVRFGHGLEQVGRDQLTRQIGLAAKLSEALTTGTFDDALEVVARVQARAIRSLHDEWGVFAASRIELLPHQLWVCQQVNQTWPPRLLIADDVGLGKSVEAGMILSALLFRGRVKRLLVLCPASLVGQWQSRMREMFDLRLAAYSPEQDTDRTPFWSIHDQAVASFHTLRITKGKRQERLLEAEPWDLILVDEAHHLNADEAKGTTLGYRLLEKLNRERKMQGLIFFTGTPHRGKNYGFLSLLSLLRPDVAAFDPANSTLARALPHLPEVMIRNNKANVTDLAGKRLFHTPRVSAQTYSYSPEEQHFYDQMTEFVAKGQMYARTLNRTQSEAVGLTLTTLQKLASSSVAAIRRALANRLAHVREQNEEIAELLDAYREAAAGTLADGAAGFDTIGELDEKIAEARLGLLMNDEESALRALLAAADAVTHETKITALLEAVTTRFAGRSVLFFTEYKATQSLVMSALIERFGDDCVTFINGDGAARDVRLRDGRIVTLTEERTRAAERFNRGEVRFLVATEAAGEGIDLQKSCHTLVHVDLPWNPMRLHQRVGRLNRYGQTHAVDVLSLRNPNTVDGRIWELLDAKMQEISRAFDAVMDEPEDLMQLVLGMSRAADFTRLFAEGNRNRNRLGEWVEKNTAGMGGRDVVEMVREIVGSSRRFDLGRTSSLVPRVDLPDLRPFFETALTLGGRLPRRPQADGEGGVLGFKTPDEWREDAEEGPRIRPSYEGVTFDRRAGGRSSGQILGIGHPLVNVALRRHTDTEASVAQLPPSLADVLDRPLVAVRLYSEETLGRDGPQPLTVGALVPLAEGEAVALLQEEALLRLLNRVSERRGVFTAAPLLAARHGGASGPSEGGGAVRSSGDLPGLLDRAREAVRAAAADGRLPHRFRYPAAEPFAVLLPPG